MLPIVITSLVLSKTRSLGEIVPQKWRENWEQYLQLRVVVMLSLIFQIILITLGGRRKIIRHYWMRIVVWCAYLSADAVAIYAVGVIQIKHCLKGSNLLRTFWAPFLLMHLGGPDTITAYALEDNELWLRHGLTLVNQATATLYILFHTWNGSYISWLYVVVFICGLIKYIERVFTLWAGSSETFRESTPDRHQTIPRMLEEYKVKEAEGHDVVAHKVIEVHQVLDGDVGGNSTPEQKKLEEEILIARGLIDVFRPAFTDQLLSLDDEASGRSALEDRSDQSVFNIIAIELGFIYDLLFTKAMLFQSTWGIASRVVTFSLTIINLGVFTSLYSKEASKYDKTDLVITFVLMVAAICIELYGFLVQHLFSDKFIYRLIKHKRTRILSIVNWLRPLSKRQRWSGKIGQFSLLSYSLKEKHYCGHLEIDGFQRYFYISHRSLQNSVKRCIFLQIKKIPTAVYTDMKSYWASWTAAEDVHLINQLKSLHWSIPEELDFDMSILVWHIATAICCHASDSNFQVGRDDAEVIISDAQISLDLSRYMMYLLVMYPSSLPAGQGRIKFKDMHSTMTTFFKQYKSNGPQEDNIAKSQTILDYCTHQLKLDEENTSDRHAEPNVSRKKLKLTDACNKLLKQVNTQLNLTVSSTDKSKFVMFYGCHLASQLMEYFRDRIRFAIMRDTWLGLLMLAAMQCKASYHLQNLRSGGELLTHVWLLLVHFGFTNHFKIPKNVEIAELIIK